MSKAKHIPKSSFSFIFFINRSVITSDGTSAITARITVNKVMSSFSTHLSINPDRWLPKEYRTLGITREEKQINTILEELRVMVKRKYHDMLNSGETISALKLRNVVLQVEDKCISLVVLCTKFNEDYYQLVVSGSVTKDTCLRYELLKTSLVEYMQKRNNTTDISLADINHSFIKGYDLYLRTERKNCNNTASKMIKHFRTVYNMALNNGWITTDRFAGYKITFEKTDRGYLTNDELQKLMTKPIENKRLNIVRDMFIFSCYCNL